MNEASGCYRADSCVMDPDCEFRSSCGETVTMAEETVIRVRELHAPRWHDEYHQSGQVWLVCPGCDEGAHAESPPPWPCRTAEIVYSDKEIAAREPQIAECTADHGLRRDGQPIRPQAVFIRHQDGPLMAARWNCDHVAPVPAESDDPW